MKKKIFFILMVTIILVNLSYSSSIQTIKFDGIGYKAGSVNSVYSINFKRNTQDLILDYFIEINHPVDKIYKIRISAQEVKDGEVYHITIDPKKGYEIGDIIEGSFEFKNNPRIIKVINY